MIYVQVEAVKSEGRGCAVGNGWQDTDDVLAAITAELASFHAMWDDLGHGVATSYTIVVATEASPRRTTGEKRWPLPPLVQPRDQPKGPCDVSAGESDRDDR